MKRTKFNKPQQKILAKATPNPNYIYINCIQDVSFIAVLNSKRITFTQIDDIKGQRSISEDFVKQMFADEGLVKRRPFTKKGNEEFYAVLHRHRRKYRPVFERLCQTKN